MMQDTASTSEPEIPKPVIFPRTQMREEGDRVIDAVRSFLEERHSQFKNLKIEYYLGHNQIHTIKITYPPKGQWGEQSQSVWLNAAMALLGQNPLINNDAAWQREKAGGQPPLRYVLDTQEVMPSITLDDGTIINPNQNHTALYVTIDAKLLAKEPALEIEKISSQPQDVKRG